MSPPTIGIDFGTSTSTSSMAWLNPRTRQAEIIKNAEGEEKTPSVVYFGAGAPVVGSPAELMLEDEGERRRVVASVKRNLLGAPTLALPDRRVRPVEVAAAIFAKLKRDAEELHFRAPVTRAVVTCPAAFDVMEREAIAKAARLGGFEEIRLLDEPVAAALAYRREGLEVGRHVLVYDLGGGTFDLALLRESEDGFELIGEPKGLRRCGGDDFDAALYDYCEELALQQWGEPLDGTGRDLKFLRDCRKRKENLSAHDKALFSSLVGRGRVFKHSLGRAEFEGLIAERVQTTVRLTGELARAASDQGCPVETVVLIGGSSRVPLIQSLLAEALPVAPRKYGNADVAVALGAAYVAERTWALQSAPPVDDRSERLARYRVAVTEVGLGESLDENAVGQLAALAEELRLDAEQAHAIEREILGEAKETVALKINTNSIHIPSGLALTLTGQHGRFAKFFENHEIRSVAFSPNGQLVAVGSGEQLMIFEVVSGQLLHILNAIAFLGGVPTGIGITSMAFSPNGCQLAAVGRPDFVGLWEFASNRTHTLSISNGLTLPDVNSVAFSPDGRTLVSADAKRIKVWDVGSGQQLRILKTGHAKRITSVAFSPDGQWLASGSDDTSVKLWH